MPRTEYEFTGNAAQLIAELHKIQEAQQSAGNEAKELLTLQRKFYQDGANAAQKANEVFARTGPALGAAVTPIKNLEKEITDYVNKAAKASKETKEYADEVKKVGAAKGAIAGVTKEIDKAAKAQDRLNNETKKSPGLFGKIGDVTRGVLAATGIQAGIEGVINGFRSAIRTISQFQSAISELKAITGASGKDLDFLRNKAIELGRTTNRSAIEVVEAFKLVGSAKPELLKNSQALAAVTEQVITLSNASGLDLATATESLTGSLNQFSAGADQAGRFINVLAAGAKEGSSEIPQSAEALKNFGVVAASANVSIEETTALIQALSDKSIKGAEAGTALRNILLTLSNAKGLDKASLNAFKEAGINVDILSDKNRSLTERLTEAAKLLKTENGLLDVFKKENVVAAQAVLENVGRVDQLTKAVTGTNEAYKQASDRTDNLKGDTERLSSAWDSFILSVESGEGVIAKALRGIIQLAGGAVEGLRKLSISDEQLNQEKLARQVKIRYEAMIKDIQAGVENDVQFTMKLAQQEGKIIADVEGLRKAKLKERTDFYRDALFQGLQDLKRQRDNLSDGDIDGAKKLAKEVIEQTQLLDSLRAYVEEQNKVVEKGAEEAAAKAGSITDEQIKEQLRKQQEREQALLDLRKRELKAQIELAEGDKEQQLRLTEKYNLLEFEEFKKGLLEKGKAADANFKFTAEQEEQLRILRLAITNKTEEELFKLRKQEAEKQAAEDDRVFKNSIDKLQNQEAILLEQVKQFKQLEGETETEFETRKQKQILAIQIEYAKKQLELLAGKTDSESMLQVEKLKTLIAEAEAELDKIAKGEKKFSWAKLLGVSEEDFENWKAGAVAVANTVRGILEEQFAAEQALLDRKKRLIDEELQANEDRLSDLRDQLTQEIELNKQGFASNVDAVRAEIEQTEKLRQEALEKERAIKQQQQELARKQAALETIQQAGALITASANLYKVLSPLGPVGIGIAGFTIAAMIGSFIAAKAKAKEATAEFYEGGYTGDGNEREEAGIVHKKEFVSNAKTTKRHRKLLEAMHKEDYTGLSEKDLPKEIIALRNLGHVDLPTPMPVKHLDRIQKITEAAQSEKQEEVKARQVQAELLSKLDRLESIDNGIKSLNEKESVLPLPDGRIMTTKNGKVKFTKP